MTALRFLSIAPATPVLMRGRRPAPESEVDKRVDSVWRQALKATRGALHDGVILSVTSATEDHIEVEALPYRYYAAQHRDPSLASVLAVWPLAVSGIIFCEGKVILGRRSSNVMQDQGMLELVPGGSVDEQRVLPDGSVDLVGQFLVELHEELGVTAGPEPRPRLLGFIEDEKERVIDAVLTLSLPHSEAAVRHAHANSGSAEYTALLFATPEEIHWLVADDSQRLSPVTRLIFQSWDTVIRAKS